jgi:hypothetical protein
MSSLYNFNYLSIFLISLLFISNDYILNNFADNNYKLFDLLHYLTPDYFTNLSPISDFMTITLLVISSIFLYNKHSVIPFYKCIVLCQLLKKFVGMLTILPDSSGYCEKKSFQIILGRCNDLVISGHACTILTCYFFLSPYIKSSILSIYVILNLILIVLSRNHYTIDVIFSFFVTNFIFEKWTPVSVLQKPQPMDHFYNH